QAEEVTGFGGVTATLSGSHVLLKLELKAGARILAIKQADVTHIAINLMAGGMQSQRLSGNEKPMAALLQANECQVVLSGERLLLHIVTEDNVGFAFDFSAQRAGELAAQLANLAGLLTATPSGADPLQ